MAAARNGGAVSGSRLRSILLLNLAVPSIVTGGWALIAPHSWHDDFPWFGRHWLPVFGAYNEHLARDFGGALLALGVLLLWAALAPRVSVWRAAAASYLFFAAPHLAYHLAHIGDLPTGDDIVNLALLVGSVALPVAVLLMPEEAPPSLRVPPREADGARLPPARSRNPLVRLTYAVSRRRYGHVLGPLGVTAHNPTLLAGYSTFELALERANRVDRRLEELGAMRAATLTGCPFCIDFGSAHLGELGFTPEQVRDVARWRDSGAFSEDERLVLEYAEGMTATPVQVSDELFGRLRDRFDEAAIVELTASIAIENYRGRFNHAVGLGSEGFCEVPAAGNGRPTEGAIA
jgi:AhpD family alkylhydroperoxidase